MTAQTEEIERDRWAHGWSGLLATWRLCDKAACRRARVCRGAGHACLRAKFTLLPEPVQVWFLGLHWHRDEQFSFDETIEILEASGHNAAMRDWYEEGIAHAGREPAHRPDGAAGVPN